MGIRVVEKTYFVEYWSGDLCMNFHTWGCRAATTVRIATGIAIVAVSTLALSQTARRDLSHPLAEQDKLLLPAVLYDIGVGKNSSITLADVDGDGNLDVVATNECQLPTIGCSDGYGFVAVMLGKGDGTFGSAVLNGSG